ncbi:MAG: DUF2304 domain-containing protein [Isosphaeraceae bacterium]|nr:DUF2304 domain-containing protein [Isosphaeraceae bacterium]
MKLFQYIAVATLLAALLSEAARAVRRRRVSTMGLIRGLTWITAAVTILFPELVQAAALRVGIHRGTDLILYVFILLFIFTSFYFYARHRQIQRQVTELIRSHAIEHARRGGRTARDNVLEEQLTGNERAALRFGEQGSGGERSGSNRIIRRTGSF